MSEHNLSKSLLQAGTAEQPGLFDSLGQTVRILERDRRRVRLLGIATVAFWLLGVCGIALVLYELSVNLPEYVSLRSERAGTTSIERRQNITEGYLVGIQIGIVVFACSAVVLALAALGTFLLVLDTRRATLRQINASLLLISQRLERFQDLSDQRADGHEGLCDSRADRRAEP
jgi:hypothetical protein